MKAFSILLLLLYITGLPAQQQSNKYGLAVITNIDSLQKTIAADSNKTFVHIKDYVPGVVLDIKYATTQNVFYEKLYDKPYAIIRLPVAKALANVQAELNNLGLGLKIYDAYRPYSVTCRMWDLMPDSTYMGKPWRGSHHNKGVALDLTLIDFKSKKELRMPTPFDALINASHPRFTGLPDSIIKNRDLLITTMTKYGFIVDSVEWWHYNYKQGLAYELLDLSHKEMLKIIKKKKK